MDYLKEEYQNGQIQFKLSVKEKNMKESKSLKMMRLPEERLMLKKRLISNN